MLQPNMSMSFQQASRFVGVTVLCAAVMSCQVAEIPQSTSESPRQVTDFIDNTSASVAVGEREVTSSQENVTETPQGFTTAWERLRAGLRLQQHYQHAEVDAQLSNYRGNQRLFDLIAARAEPFLFQIMEEIEQRDLPLELALLPIVESTYNPQAHSSENAVGLWQILGSTGRSLGLQQDWWYDARRDPRSATARGSGLFTGLVSTI